MNDKTLFIIYRAMYISMLITGYYVAMIEDSVALALLFTALMVKEAMAMVKGEGGEKNE